MKRKRQIVISLILLVLFSPILFRKYRVSLLSNGRTVVVATRPFILPLLGEGESDVYIGSAKAFSLWVDDFHSPIFIYPFADGKRFLCDYNDDTAILVFVIDLSGSSTNLSYSTDWPYGNYNFSLSSRMTNVVIDTKGLVRMPNCAELQEVSSYITNLAPAQVKGCSFPWCDLGLYRTYASKEYLLADLATNRTSAWP